MQPKDSVKGQIRRVITLAAAAVAAEDTTAVRRANSLNIRKWAVVVAVGRRLTCLSIHGSNIAVDIFKVYHLVVAASSEASPAPDSASTRRGTRSCSTRNTSPATSSSLSSSNSLATAATTATIWRPISRTWSTHTYRCGDSATISRQSMDIAFTCWTIFPLKPGPAKFLAS